MILHSSINAKNSSIRLLQSIEPKRISLNLTIAEVVAGTGICLNTYMGYKDNDFSKLTFEKFAIIQDFFLKIEQDSLHKENFRVNCHSRNRLTMSNPQINPDLSLNGSGMIDDEEFDEIYMTDL